MFHRIYDIVKRKLIRDKRKEHLDVQPLRIEGCKTKLTPEPDDAELAAQALLESMAQEQQDKGKRKGGKAAVVQQHTEQKKDSSPHDAAYYRELAERIRNAHAQEIRRAKRYMTYADKQLNSPTCELAEIERGLYPFQDCVDREGGELKRRWQRLLAEVIVRQMSEGSGGSGQFSLTTTD